MKKYQIPELEMLMISDGDIITASPGTEGPIIDVKDDVTLNFDSDTGMGSETN